ncbi:TolC family protein [Hyphomicrobium sp. 2TAF46]|uniref:TolC family protein n=1 Tax=Hyphomicrobium sp. 2TAF46 TaxID=3233019 RepID=UPI003F9334D5
MKRISALFIFFAMSCGANAQSLPAQITLRGVLDLALRDSPRAALDEQDVEAARADKKTASAYPNPKLSYTGSHQPGELTNFSSKNAHDVSIEMPLLIGGQRQARKEAAQKGIEAAAARATASGINRAVEAGAAYIGLLVAQEKLKTQMEHQTELARLRDIVRGRQASGMASEYDSLRLDVEMSSFRTDIAETKSDLAERQGQLASICGYKDWRPRGVNKLKPWSIVVGSEDLAAIADHPNIVAARRDEAFSRAGVEAARRERFPEVSLTGDRFWTDNPYGATTSVGVSIEVPIFDTRIGAVEKAQAESKAAALKRQVAEVELEADLTKFRSQVVERTQALKNFQKSVAPRLPELKRMAEDAYRLRGGSIMDLLDATRSRTESQMNYIELVGRLMEAQLRYEATRGGLVALFEIAR